MKPFTISKQIQVEAERKKQEERKVIPHFWNLNEDPSLTAMVIHFCREGKGFVCVCVHLSGLQRWVCVCG